MSAADNQKFEFCDWLIKNGADVNATMPTTGWTAMHAAAKRGDKDIIRLLLKNGGDKNLRARHRDFGSQCTVADIAVGARNHHVLDILKKCC